MVLDANQVVKVACGGIFATAPLRRDRLRPNAARHMTTPALSAPTLLMRGVIENTPSSVEEGWRAERRGGCNRRD